MPAHVFHLKSGTKYGAEVVSGFIRPGEIGLVSIS